MAHRYVGWPKDVKKTYLFTKPEKSSSKFRQVIWGDYLTIDGEEPGGWYRVIWAPKVADKRKTVYIPKDHTVKERPLEIIFLDVGQGDGAVLVSPETGNEERIMVIDAGEKDNMERFLDGRFKAYRGFNFHAAILTHPDKDHYFGFRNIFDNNKIGFDVVYQNGLVERPVSGTFAKIGQTEVNTDNNKTYFTDLAKSRADLKKYFWNDPKIDDYDYPPIMRSALKNRKIKSFKMLSTEHGKKENGKTYIPKFSPSNNLGYSIEVLGPIAEKLPSGKYGLRKISSNYGKVKNGHSIILRLQYGDFSVLFGGDLNIPAEKFLLSHYSGLSSFPRSGSAAHRNMIDAASKRFRSDVMKTCHHGSEKVTDEFLQVVNPAAFVISSGDQESHVHPRPDLLGRLGIFGRGGAPVLLATEILRSTREKEDEELVVKLEKEVDELVTKTPTANRIKKIKDKIATLAKLNVETYGAIYLKTDGTRLMTAFRIENKSAVKRWFFYSYELLENGELIRKNV